MPHGRRPVSLRPRVRLCRSTPDPVDDARRPRWRTGVADQRLDQRRRRRPGARSAVAAALDVGGAPRGHADLALDADRRRPTHDDVAAAARARRCGRELLQLRRPLPVPETVARRRSTSRPGRSDPAPTTTAWLDGQQPGLRLAPRAGGLDRRATCSRARREPWFDPDGLPGPRRRRRPRSTASAGPRSTPTTDDGRRSGEIYVIGVDPDVHGRGPRSGPRARRSRPARRARAARRPCSTSRPTTPRPVRLYERARLHRPRAAPVVDGATWPVRAGPARPAVEAGRGRRP